MAKAKPVKAQWQNRITGYGNQPASWFLANEDNWRIHPKPQADGLEGVLDTVGWVQDVIVNRRTSPEWGAAQNVPTMVDGHLRVTLALRQGDDTPVPLKWVDLTPAEEALVLASLDPLGAMAATDKAKLDDLLRMVQSDDARVQAMIANLAEREGLEYGKAEPAEDPGAEIDRAEELREKWGVELGQLWQLGEHRLICGDCTDRAVVERVMDGEKAAMGVTSPPYPEAEMWETEGNTLIEIGDTCLDITRNVIAEGGVLCWNTSDIPCGNGGMACNPARDTMTALDLGWNKRAEIVWEKGLSYLPAPWNTRRPTVPNQTHELVLVFYNGERIPREKKGNLADDALAWNRETVWKISPAKANEQNHKAPFPTDLAKRCVTLFSYEGDIVYEPFCGSGTTIIACENLGRHCRAIELDPKYVAVALERWATMTGQNPRLLEGV